MVGCYSKSRQVKIDHRKEIFFRNYAIHLLYVATDCDKVIIDLRTVIVFTFYCKNFALSPKTSIS